MTSSGLKDKAILIAGAATGLGAATAHRLAADGANVIVGDLDLAGATRTAAAITDLGVRQSRRASTFPTTPRSGIWSPPWRRRTAAWTPSTSTSAPCRLTRADTDVVDIGLDVWDQVIAVNLRGHMLVTRHAVPELLARGGRVIVCTSSLAAFTGEARRPAYSVTKAGINTLTRHVASRWGRDGIRANAVAPGLIVTDKIRDGAPPGLLEKMLARTPSTRHGEEADVAAMVAYLMSDEATWITGQVINVDGGTVMR